MVYATEWDGGTVGEQSAHCIRSIIMLMYIGARAACTRGLGYDGHGSRRGYGSYRWQAGGERQPWCPLRSSFPPVHTLGRVTYKGGSIAVRRPSHICMWYGGEVSLGNIYIRMPDCRGEVRIMMGRRPVGAGGWHNWAPHKRSRIEECHKYDSGRGHIQQAGTAMGEEANGQNAHAKDMAHKYSGGQVWQHQGCPLGTCGMVLHCWKKTKRSVRRRRLRKGKDTGQRQTRTAPLLALSVCV